MKKILYLLSIIALVAVPSVFFVAQAQNSNENLTNAERQSQLVELRIELRSQLAKLMALYQALISETPTHQPNPPTPTIVVTAPDGGQPYAGGDTMRIRWRSINVDNVSIYLCESFLDTRSSCEILSAGAKNIPAYKGAYDWRIDPNHPYVPSERAFIQVREAATRTNVYDNSGVFRIEHEVRPGKANIEVTSPNGGEEWIIGTTRNITWDSKNLPANSRITISLFKEGSGQNIQIIDNLPASQESYRWVVNHEGNWGLGQKSLINKFASIFRVKQASAAAPVYRIKVSVNNVGNTSFLNRYDMSDSYFMIREKEENNVEIDVDLVSTKTTIGDTNSKGETGWFDIIFDVTPSGGDAYISKSCYESDGGGVHTYRVILSNGARKASSACAISSPAYKGDYRFRVKEGDKERFRMRVSVEAAEDGLFGVKMNNISWAESDRGRSKNYSGDLSRFRTNFLNLEGLFQESQETATISNVDVANNQSRWVNRETIKRVTWSYEDVPLNRSNRLRFKVGLYSDRSGGIWGNNVSVPINSSSGNSSVNITPSIHAPWFQTDYYIKVRLVNANGTDYKPEGRRIEDDSDDVFQVVGENEKEEEPLISHVKINNNQSVWQNRSTRKTITWSYNLDEVDNPTDKQFRVGLYTNDGFNTWGNRIHVPVTSEVGTQSATIMPETNSVWYDRDIYIRVRLYNADGSEYRNSKGRVEGRSDETFRITGPVSTFSDNQMANVINSLKNLTSNFNSYLAK